jgi:hypothetical protein
MRPGATAEGAQDRHLAPPFVEAGEDRREHAKEECGHDEGGDGHERRVGHANQLPPLAQRHPRRMASSGSPR